MKEDIKDFLINSLVSSGIGFVIGIMNIIFFDLSRSDIAFVLINSSIIGLVIGTISRFWVIFLYIRKKLDIKIVFLMIFLTIAIISGGPSLIFAIFDKSKVVTIPCLIMIGTAEILGLTFSYISIKEVNELNSKLSDKKNEFLKEKRD